jgi:DNA topoisomerase-3
MVPPHWSLSVLAGTKEQFETVKRLLNAPETTKVVCATDAGREGELIFRNIYEAAGCRKTVERLWISSLTEDAIRSGFARLRPSAEYDLLAAAARARARADWMVGLNLTRAYSPAGSVVSVGRVQTPTLALIVDRDRCIESFVAEPYCEVEAVFGVSETKRYGGKLVRRDAAQKVLTGAEGTAEAGGGENSIRHSSDVRVDPAWQQVGGIIERVQEQLHREHPPMLYDLTDLQRHANRVFGMSAQETLERAQALYEKKLLTYPRTDCRFVPVDVAKTLPAIASVIERRYAGITKTGACQRPLPERFVNDAKITDHHAILLTAAVAGELTEGEERIYDLVCRRLVSCWLPEYVSAVTTVLTWTAATGAKDLWLSKGTVVVERGWKTLDIAPRSEERDREDVKNPALPAGLARGIQSQVLSIEVKKKRTRPPARLTEASLLTAMESAGKTLEEAELSAAMRERGLGTPATRAAIIELLVARGYVERRKKQLQSTALGRSLIEAVAPDLRSAELTGRWEAYLKSIERGAGSEDRFMASIATFVAAVVERVKRQGGSPVRGGVETAGGSPSGGHARKPRGKKAKSSL